MPTVILRPSQSNAFHPYEIDKVVGKTVKKDIDKYQVITKKIIKK
jgi:sialic acid synthase SpsE